MADSGDVIERMLTTYDTITVVGASANPEKSAHGVPRVLQAFGWRIIPVNPHHQTVLGVRAYPTLADVPEQVGLVDVFRPASEAPEIARQAVAAGATALWLQLGIRSREAREIAESAGLLYVEDRCTAVERARRALRAPEPAQWSAQSSAQSSARPPAQSPPPQQPLPEAQGRPT